MRLPTIFFLLTVFFFCSTEVFGWGSSYPPTGFAMLRLRNDVQMYEEAVRSQNKGRFRQIFLLKNPYDNAELTREMQRYRHKKLQVVSASPINTTMVIGKIRVSDAQGHADSVLHDVAAIDDVLARSPTGMKILYIQRP